MLSIDKKCLQQIDQIDYRLSQWQDRIYYSQDTEQASTPKLSFDENDFIYVKFQLNFKFASLNF